ncbi:hypothetical protein GCM10011487_56670 [Steroidobacter agaridevorans]|uniref:IrrE N-terminal-like domain-containing protein n=1 Tax=Steroidobacter agaridevorans TaxID=2695856 RepID=A0A829YJY8_9GAMM|nr:ImmA/IrrE family metallo-endopeptidase [Steroidobacter agaridevorans]GFE83667.1 hypothetical protein GCM10011487_56670 [Steroidobacter agaridevorans]
MTARKLEQQRFRQLGLQAAQELQRLHGDLFETYPIRSSRVARRLGIRVVRSDVAAERGRIYLGTGLEREHSHAVIYLSSAQRLEDARFDLAHEIGHAMLHQSPHEMDGRLPVDSHEAFANAFASSLLVPSNCESEIVRRLSLCTTPDDMLALAGSFGISVPRLFSAISLRPHWMQGIDSVWLRIRLMTHPYGRGRNAKKLRIDHLLFDYSRTFMPRYQGIASCMSPSDWFDALSVGANSSARVVTLRHWSRNAAGDRTRFSRAETTMRATVKRLAAFRGAFTEMFLLSLVPV